MPGQDKHLSPEDMVAAATPCPFCGSTTLAYAEWFLDSGVSPAIECEHCFAGAPFEAWQRRDGVFEARQTHNGAIRILTAHEAGVVESALRLCEVYRETGGLHLPTAAIQVEELAELINNAESITIRQINQTEATK